jgi:hypothetical protein
VKAIFGCNGAVWVGRADGSSGSITPSQVQAAAQVAQAVRALAAAGQVVSPAAVEHALAAAATAQ